MKMADRLAEERRARLAAERLLELKQAQLSATNRKLGDHARQLTNEITETRAEVAEVRSENQRITMQLGEATQKIELVEDQLWKALETVRDGFAMFDARNRLEIANPAYLSLFENMECVGPGVTYAELLQLLAEEGIVDLQGEGSEDWQARQYARWGAEQIEPETLKLWNGRFIKIQDRRTPDGGMVSLSTDITELMRMWSAVEELPDGFVLFDEEDRLVTCNQPYRDIYAASAPAILPGNSFEDILRYGLERGQYQSAIGQEETWLEDRLIAHRAADRELEQHLDDGRWLRVYERETRGGGRVGLRVDITEIKQDQQRLKEATVRAEAANRAKSAFLANMSHEIRTPMNGVVGMADLMMETDLSEEQRLYLDTIRSSGEALLVIINDILDYSKIEADKLELHPEPFDLERAIHEVVMLLQPTARDKDIQLLMDYDMFLPTRFVGDPGRIRQVLTNILGNAVKFTIEGHVLIRVVGMVADTGPSAIHITIEDTGIGIPEDKVAHVFGEFNQVEDERNRNFEGTGLGLAITKRLVEMMQGEVWVESELGKGSCFGMRILLEPDEPVTYESAKLPQHLKSVLVVDDHNANRAILAKQLDILGLQSTFCTTGAEAIDQLQSGPDLLIVEQDLPDMQGRELAVQMRDSGHDLPVILMAHSAAGHDLETTGIYAVLQKPVPRRALFEALEKTPPPRARPVSAPLPEVEKPPVASVAEGAPGAAETLAGADASEVLSADGSGAAVPEVAASEAAGPGAAGSGAAGKDKAATEMVAGEQTGPGSREQKPDGRDMAGRATAEPDAISPEEDRSVKAGPDGGEVPQSSEMGAAATGAADPAEPSASRDLPDGLDSDAPASDGPDLVKPDTVQPAPVQPAPVQPSSAQADAAGSEPAPTSLAPITAAPPGEADPSACDKLDVLVAEDNKTNQLVFRKMAAAFDVDLRFANNGIEAVEAFKSRRPQLIFMDISMPKMDGKQATREIRQIEGDGPRVPIVAVTAHAMAGDREAILEAGLDDYLTKPLRKAALGEKIALYRSQIETALAS